MALLDLRSRLQDVLESLQVAVNSTAEVPLEERRDKRDRTAELDLSRVGEARSSSVGFDETVAGRHERTADGLEGGLPARSSRALAGGGRCPR